MARISLVPGINPMLAYMEDLPKLGYKFSKIAATYSKGTEAYYFIEHEYKENGERFFEVVQKNPSGLFSVLARVNQAAEQIFKLGKKWENTNFSNLTNSQLLAAHKELFKWDAPLWRNGQIPNLLELHNSFLTEHVKQIIQKNFSGNQPEYFKILTTSTYKTLTEKQDEDFLKLLKNPSTRKLRSHWQKYRWMTYGWSGPELS